jgi:arylsulfatase A-like enzyme
MPTILDLLGVDVPNHTAKQLRGTSLRTAMEGRAPARDVFAETDYREFTFQRSIIAPDNWKLIYYLESKTRELYDLNRDPGEARNLAATEKNRADELERRLFAHYRSIGYDLSARRWEKGLNPVYPSQGK